MGFWKKKTYIMNFLKTYYGNTAVNATSSMFFKQLFFFQGYIQFPIFLSFFHTRHHFFDIDVLVIREHHVA